MAKLELTPWHEAVKLRNDLKTGELSLAQFAADLYEVHMGRGRAIYQEPKEFFALTYPTYSLRELVKEVFLRLAGKSEKAIRSLKLTYGGGKTHALITLHHLVSDPAKLPDLPAVKEFVSHAGMKPPKARVVVLPFDKLDVERGMEVRGPGGETRWLKHPWNVLAWQIAGAEGLKLLRERGDGERETNPAENLLHDLLDVPRKRDEAVLILLDELLMYARAKVGEDPSWRGRLVDFFQVLTQAVEKAERAAIVASILDTNLAHKKDELGGALAQELHVVFHRQAEEDIEPVGKEDVAEVLRRRFFKPESVKDPKAFKPHVVAALQGVKDLDDSTRKDPKGAEERFLKAFPFHPDLTEVFYSKWTQLGGFQPTRGILRTFAVALRDAEKWDKSPLVGPAVFLGDPESTELCPAAKELAGTAQRDEYEGRQHDWTAILTGELGRARAIQEDSGTLKGRELEQAVAATFLHSQPVGQKAALRDLHLLVGPTRPDKIELEKALRRWAEDSWFLDEGVLLQDRPAAGELPKFWRLGTKPNLNQMHRTARERVAAPLVEEKLAVEIPKVKSLTSGARDAGASVHVLPDRPSNIDDDGQFRYAVLGPKAASDPGKPSPEARRYLEEKTGPQNPRVRRNLVVLAVPSTDGIALARERVADSLAWEEVATMPETQKLDEGRRDLLESRVREARRKIHEAITQAYCVVVVQGEDGSTQARKVTVGDEGLFTAIKRDRNLRVQETPIDAAALLPGGPYDLWKPGENSRRVKDLVDAFAQDPRLPKMVRSDQIVETLKLGVREGQFVLSARRPDESLWTVWRADAGGFDLTDPRCDVVLLDAAELAEVPAHLLAPGALAGLWPEGGGAVAVGAVVGFFDGAHTVPVQREGYAERLRVPKAAREAVEKAVREAVRAGHVWLTTGPASVFREEVPAGLLSDDAVLNPPPPVPSPAELLPAALPAAWREGVTTATALATALSQRAGKVLPWPVIRDAIDGAIRARMLDRAADSAPWPTEWAGADRVKLCVPKEAPPPPEPTGPRVYRAEAELSVSEIQNLGEEVGAIQAAAAGLNPKFVVRFEMTPQSDVPKDALRRVEEALKEVSPKLQIG